MADPSKMQKTQVIEGHGEENEDATANQDSSDMEISVKPVENQDRADVIVQGVGKGNSGIERLSESSHCQELNAAPSCQQNLSSQPIRTDLAAQFKEPDDDFLACSRNKAIKEHKVERFGKTYTKLASTIPKTLLKENKKLSDQENGRERPIGAYNKENPIPNLTKAQSSGVILEPKNKAVGKDGSSL